MRGQIRQVETADGTASVQVFRPEGPVSTGVILYMDAFGPRPALEGMAARMAAMGHVVLLPDLFYRAGAYGPFDPVTAFGNDTTRAQLMGLMGATSAAMTVRDTAALLQVLEDEGAKGAVATVGYCMGGGRALHAAAAYPDRIKAAASLHGGNLASDAADSPHLKAGAIKAQVYVGSAGVDPSFPPAQSARLAQALREAEVTHVIENYVGCQHGWCVPDSAAHNGAGAARHWRRLAVLFAESLTG